MAFGAMPEVCCWLWDRINPCKMMPNGICHKHLLWGLHFLKVCDSKENSAHAVGDIDESLIPADLLAWYENSDDEEDTVEEVSDDVEVS